MLIVPTVTGIRTFIGRPSVPHFSISPATCQGQAADAVAALAHARNLRPLALEILCVPRFAHLQKILNTAKTDRFTDALIYALSLFPAPKRADSIGQYKVIRTDQRFHPHYRNKIYRQNNSFCADLPYGYLNLYANATLTLSDRVHACAATLAFGNSAMLFVNTDRLGLLGRVGAEGITVHPVQLDLNLLADEKSRMVAWLEKTMTEDR